MPERLRGRIAKWLDTKACGFITPEDGGNNGKDYWVQATEVNVDQGRQISIAIGEEVEFSLKPAPEAGTMQACDVTGIGGTPVRNQGGDRGPPMRRGFSRSRSRRGRSPPRGRPPPRRGYSDSRSRSRGRGGPPRGGGGGGFPPRGDPAKLFIGQLTYEATEEEIREKFADCGEIRSIQVVKDRETGKSKGFGFIEFVETNDAEDALRNMNGVEIGGRAIRLDRSGQGGKNQNDGWRGGGGGGFGGKSAEPNKIFVGKLGFDATEDDIRDVFSKVGDVQSVRIVKDRDTGESKGYGFVEFADVRDAEEALVRMNGVDIAGSSCRLEAVGGRPPQGGGKGGGRGARSESRSRSRRRSMSPPRRFRPPPARRGRSGGRPPYGDSWGGEGMRRRRRGYRGDDMDRGMGDRGPRRRRQMRSESRGGSSGSRPAGVPKKRKAIQAAQEAFDDAEAAAVVVRKEATATEATLKKMEAVAEQAVARKVLKVKKAVKAELAAQIDRMKKESHKALTDALEDSESSLHDELAERIKDLKKEFAQKVKDASQRIQGEHAASAVEAEKMLTEQADQKIQEVQEKAEDEEAPKEWREAFKSVNERREEADEKALAAKKRLESLTGRTYASGAQPGRRGGQGGNKRPPGQGPKGDEDYSYYSDYSDVEGAPPGR